MKKASNISSGNCSVNGKILVIAISVFGGCSVHQKWDVFKVHISSIRGVDGVPHPLNA
jgi:hypothetical protein